MPANISGWVCAAQPVTTIRAPGRSRFSRRIDCRACATASLVTAQLLMTMVSESPARSASRAITSDSKALRRQPKVTTSTLMSQATEANSAGSNRPSYSKVAVPVISTWSSRSRHSIRVRRRAAMICTMRLARFSRAAATAVAQAAEPQALVSPAPRSQVRIVMWSRSTICASVMLARSRKDRMIFQ